MKHTYSQHSSRPPDYNDFSSQASEASPDSQFLAAEAKVRKFPNRCALNKSYVMTVVHNFDVASLDGHDAVNPTCTKDV